MRATDCSTRFAVEKLSLNSFFRTSATLLTTILVEIGSVRDSSPSSLRFPPLRALR